MPENTFARLLVARCRASAEDCKALCERVLYGRGPVYGQVRICELMGTDGAAARHGAAPAAVELARTPVRDIEAIARENAVEGCVRETFAALIASRQARTAQDPAIRGARAGIARDETRHAALAWAVDDWSHGLLGSVARRRLRDARREASAVLVQESSRPASPLLCELAGLPNAAECARMANALHEQLA